MGGLLTIVKVRDGLTSYDGIPAGISILRGPSP
jgi:hypothetical protein